MMVMDTHTRGREGEGVCHHAGREKEKILAIGANAKQLEMPGMTDDNTMTAVEALPGQKKPDKNVVLLDTPSGQREIPADSVVLSIGYNSDTALYSTIKDMKVPVHNIGDSNKVSNLLDAVWGSCEAAMKV